eukprot:2530304-Rhodomonas_salina.1
MYIPPCLHLPRPPHWHDPFVHDTVTLSLPCSCPVSLRLADVVSLPHPRDHQPIPRSLSQVCPRPSPSASLPASVTLALCIGMTPPSIHNGGGQGSPHCPWH